VVFYSLKVLEAASSLLHMLLTRIPSEDVETIIIAALNFEHFIMGDDAKDIALKFLKRCTSGDISSSKVLFFFSDLWNMHQTDDIDMIAGSESVNMFKETYRSQVC